MFLSSRFSQRVLALGVLMGTAWGGPVSVMSLLETRALGFQAVPQQLLDISTLDSTCLQVLKQTINCEETVADLGQREYHGSLEDAKLTDAVCVASCKSALTVARRRIEGACAKTPELLPGMTVLSYIDSIIVGWEETCLKDEESGKYCNDIIESWEEVEEIEDMPQDELCSYCYGAKLRLMQKSEYSVYDEYYAAMLEYVNKECGVEGDTTPIKQPTQNNGTQPGTCFSGKTIVTKEGDSCDSIAIANSVSGASLYYINPNLPDCKSIEAGRELCLPETCATYTVKDGDTCIEAKEGLGCAKMIVTASRSTPMDLFLEVNPSLGTAAKCDENLAVGVWYCLSPHYAWDDEQPKPTA
ncbi:lysM domain-containing protein [Colletotrichum tofieldiae]|nr:LysM domain-containing protein [Colletotrichum tofieldiae]GKT74237.1 lysM domain-containing protein [Colletotrichum tofieldiae]GKT97038.1 lysM domain-containing protein [Colletotrichum tofieldiae]